MRLQPPLNLLMTSSLNSSQESVQRMCSLFMALSLVELGGKLSDAESSVTCMTAELQHQLIALLHVSFYVDA